MNIKIRGYLLTSTGIILVAIESITDSDELQPPLGIMVNGRNLNDKLINQLANTARVSMKLFLPKEINQSKNLKEIFKMISDKKNHYSIPHNTDILHGFTVIKDVNNKPIGMFQMITPRLIYRRGVETINYYLITFIITGIIFSILMIWLLRTLIVKRLGKLNNELANISTKKSIKERVAISGQDEISSVSQEINQLLDVIQVSHEKLEQSVEERTHELQKTHIQLNQEITERKSIERDLVVHKEHLMKLAHYDHLTALPNRILFNDILSKAIHHACRHHTILAILFIDIDRFKNINDAFGHTIGDLFLKEMSIRFSSILRSDDVLARLGGDEFIILLHNIEHAKFAEPVAEKILTVCARPVIIHSHEFFVSASIGISIYPADGQSLEDLQKNADIAMYKAKRAGGGVYRYYTHNMDADAHEHVKLESELRKAIQNNQLMLYFQPQLNLKTGNIHRVEALIRWEHPEFGFISPGKFIPLAEETGLIMPIGEWIVQEACHINKQWQNEGYEPITVAVNISSVQFQYQDVALLVDNCLKKYDLDPKYLEFEITETAVMSNVEAAINKLTIIHKMGVHISIDDFGTGYTSINYLKKIPVSILKIDQGFIKGLPNNQDDVAITSAVIALGHNLGLEVVAEGVETAEQMEYLIDHQCDLVQGYYICKPLPEDKIILQFKRKES
jgi:diguanylate cyclase (GGDEF)-like protein